MDGSFACFRARETPAFHLRARETPAFHLRARETPAFHLRARETNIEEDRLPGIGIETCLG